MVETTNDQASRDLVDLTESVRIVVTGDNHLSAYLPRLTPARQALRRQRLRAGFDAAVTYAIEHGAHFFIQAGDLFDTPTPSNHDRAFVAELLARLCRAGIIPIGIGGNHDTPRMTTEQGGEAPQRTYAALDSLVYFKEHDRLAPQIFKIGKLQLAVAGLSNHPTATPGSDPLAIARLEDPNRLLSQADVALLVVHAGIEGLCQPNEGERIVTRASILALPAVFRIIVAGHIHHFGQIHFGDRTAIACGATERMEFGHMEGGSGFACVEIDRNGVQHVDHIRLREQPRADLTISTAQIWPPPEEMASAITPTMPDAFELPYADTIPDSATDSATDTVDKTMVSPATGLSPDIASTPGHTPWHPANAKPSHPLVLIRQMLAEVVTPETMVRLRLIGNLTAEQYHQLATRDILVYGQQHAFSFDLDTRGLTVTNDNSAALGEVVQAGPISPLQEVEILLDERIASMAEVESARVTDERSAAQLLSSRLRAATED